MIDEQCVSDQDMQRTPTHVSPQPYQNGLNLSQTSSTVYPDPDQRPVFRSITATSRQANGQTDLTRQRTDTSQAPSHLSVSTHWSEYAGATYLPWSKRMKHVTWAYFTLTMATGGLANVLSAVPFRFHGLYTIGLILFFLNLALYVLIWGMILTRFIMYPHSFRDSLTHPTESLFVPAFAVSFGTILITIVEYGADQAGPWLTRAVLVLFWLNCAVAIILSLLIYMVLWSTTSFTIATMTPIWIFPAYPLLIIGSHAGNLARRLQSAHQIIPVVIGGFTIQGIGFLVALTIYSAFVYRLMTQKLPAERLRPGMFVSVGPSAFTVSGTIGMASALYRTVSGQETFMDVPGLLAAQILRLVANWMSLWLWGLAFWFFFIALISNLQCFQPKHHMPFAMTWFSFVFPQTALVTATFSIASAFDVQAIRIIGCVMTVILVIVWIFVVGMMIRAIVRHDILWPEKGEDKEEGGFKRTLKKLDIESPWIDGTTTNGDANSNGITREVAVLRNEEDLDSEQLHAMANGIPPHRI